MLADETGGFAAVNRNDFNGAFDRIVAENSSYYVLGYYSTNDRRDGRFRKIEVRVKRPGLLVRARSGYYEARGRPPAAAKASNDPLDAALKAAVESPLPTTASRCGCSRPRTRGRRRMQRSRIAVELNIDALKFTQKNGTV